MPAKCDPLFNLPDWEKDYLVDCRRTNTKPIMKNPNAYHESAVLLARELFPARSVCQTMSKSESNAAKDMFEMRVSTIERHLNGLMAPVEAAANHDISQHASVESTIRAMAHRIIDLEGYLRQNAD